MTLPYQKFEEEYIQISNLTKKNITKFNVMPKYIRRAPAFIMPDGTIMCMTTEHTSADFYEDIETCVDIIKKDIPKDLKKQRLEILRQKLINDYYRFKKNSANILTSDVRSYLDVEIQPPFSYNSGLRNLFSEELQSVLISLISSKIYIYDYFLNLVLKTEDIVSSLKSYPTTIRKYHFDQMIVELEQMKKKLLEKFDISVIDSINNTLIEFSQDPINHVTDPFFMQDFIVLSAGIDKIETQIPNTITTTKLNPNEFYFNYLLMKYNIVELPAVYFDEREQKFIQKEKSDYSMVALEDRKYAEEIQLIKKKVPYQERYRYFI